jgi:hypothetical protein
MKQQQQSVNTCGATTIGKTALILMTLVTVTFSINGFIETMSRAFLYNIMLSVVMLDHYAEYCFAGCHYADSQCSEYQYADCQCGEYQYADCQCAEYQFY